MRMFAMVAAAGFLMVGSHAQDTAVVEPVGIVESAPVSQVTPAVPRESLSGDSAVSAQAPSRNLEITTEPAGAVISLDGQKSGVSPLVITGVVSGKHTVIIQKTGFYQKKIMLDITDTGTTVLHFQLLAPGKLSVVSEPPGARVFINGNERGITPFTDSLAKPGIYRLSLQKEEYNTIDDSIAVTSGGIFMYKGILSASGAPDAPDMPRTPAKHSWNKRNNLFIIGGVFVFFLATLAAIESQEQQ